MNCVCDLALQLPSESAALGEKKETDVSLFWGAEINGYLDANVSRGGGKEKNASNARGEYINMRR